MSRWFRVMAGLALALMVVTGCARRPGSRVEVDASAMALADPSAEVLIETAGDTDPDVRFWAILNLSRQASRPGAEGNAALDEAIPLLTQALFEENANLRSTAAEALGRFGSRASSATRQLARLLQANDVDSRREAAIALGRIGPAAETVVASLSQATRDREEEVRLAAIDALGRIGPPARGAISALLQVIEDGDETMRRHATDSLKQIDPAVARGLAMRPTS
ncbi:MAG: HEAT repeat domain-containing protein [Gemmataceae bacterium]